METYDAVKEFINYITAEDNDQLYGGLVDDAPESAVKAYAEYVKKNDEALKKGIIL